MKNSIKYFGLIAFVLFGLQMQAQDRDLDNYRAPDKRGINVFEAPKDTITDFDGVKVRVGGASTIQFQAIDHENSGEPLIEIGDNFNLATANLDLDVALYDGVRMHLRTYLSSRHHPEPYVKGGYIQIDKLNFVREGFMEDLMDKVTVKIGHMENNYGDAHFRRTDNAQAIHNPFVGNYIMDGFTTEVGAEVYYRDNGFIGMVGLTNGKLNQAVNNPGTTGASFLAKLGYDDYVAEDLRVRLTGSVYHTGKSSNAYLYSADRAGSRYYLVMENPDASSAGNFRSGRYNPGLRNELTAFMFNPFVKYKGLEFFGTYERASGKADAETSDRDFDQIAAELIYRFGQNENFYIGGRYNTVEGTEMGGNDIDITRYQLGAGWFMTKNILAKVEYVTQDYNGFNPGTILHEGNFNGLMLEAAISF
ncbi:MULTISPECIES: hypothetical protein [Salegentibacter]|uniref:Phosphate-selective porin O and P n=1 Tax=Salegentibacter agarivorans TaxID=345907 RepID=A0A1I2LUI8_9FLAO|nr:MULTISPECIES: hypothetical protein [Salegentibacter]APS37800.1 hypothetical protein AO058_02405 [Salegentibacter sp. T436]SFF82238.1 hypothetical protein SAMN04488033_11052 [Salegentibacter agarivorans]